LASITDLNRKTNSEIDRATWYKIDEIIRSANEGIDYNADGATEATLVLGVVVLSGTFSFRFVTIDTEGGAATDDFTSISGGRVGDRIVIQSASAARVITVVASSDLRVGVNFTLNDPSDKMELICSADGVWDQLSRTSNA